MLEAVLEGEPPHSWIKAVMARYPAAVKILDSKALSEKDAVQHLFEVQVKPELADQLLAEIHQDKDVFDVETIKSKTGRIYGSIKTRRCTVCRKIATSNCFLASVTTNSKGMAEWTVLANHDSFRELLTSLDRDGISIQVRRKTNLEDRKLLTGRQEQILYIAFDRGYFDFPKKVGLEELARQVGVKPSTLTEILRRGQRKVLEEYFGRRSSAHLKDKNRL